jgi:hypothetical protein
MWMARVSSSWTSWVTSPIDDDMGVVVVDVGVVVADVGDVACLRQRASLGYKAG